MFGKRLIAELKKVGDKLKNESRLVAQKYAEDGYTYIGTKLPTVQRFSHRVALSIEEYIPSLNTYTRDITKAYIQSHSELNREVFI